MSQAVFAKGTLFQVETSEGSGVYSTIPEVGAITGPNATSTEHDVTSHSTAGNVKETLVGLVDPGSASYPLNIVPGNTLHKQLRDDKFALTQRNYRIVEPTAEYTSFRGMVKGFNKSSPVDGPRTAQVEVRILSAPTYSD